ncbi:MAG: TIGR04222 domain-containing membrane protein, partial [Pseudonocardia sp.]|nr:TIGR04222 domain-containing membrane protein [Pseudonocardia sp.]
MSAASTWGISGPVFLVVYGVIAVAVWIASTRARQVLADPVPEQSAENLSGHPHDVAYLNGGAELAVTSALSSMHVRGTIATTKGEVRAAGRLGTDAEDLERALHFVTGSGAVPRTRLPFHRPVTTALGAIEARLATAGLLLSDGQRRRIRRVGFWMLAVAGLGLVRLLAGIAAVQPVGLLVVALLGVTVVAAVQLARAPRRSRTGDHALAALRTDCKLIAESLAPAVPPGASRTWRRARRPSERPWSASTSRSS